MVNIILIGSCIDLKPMPVDNLYMYGGFKALNMTTLYVFGTNYRSNSVCFIFAAGLLSYMNFPIYVGYTATNYFAGYFWIIFLKYVSDKDRR